MTTRYRPIGCAIVAAALGAALPWGASAQTRPPRSVDPAHAGKTRPPLPPLVVPPTPPEGPVSVTSRVDRPAIWVADRVTYTIAVTCARGFDILVDDLSRDKLKLEGLQVVGVSTNRQSVAAGVVGYEFQYVLTTYRVDAPTLTIEPVPVRYYATRAGQRPDQAAPAGTVQVPGAAVAFRSLLPDEQQSHQPRDSRPAAPRRLRYRFLGPVGAGLVLLSIAPVVLAGIALARRARQRRASGPRQSSRQARQAARASFDELREDDPTTAEGRRGAFARLDTLVRQHVDAVCGVATAGLTPGEIGADLDGCAPQVPVDVVLSILNTCELARYAGPERLPSAEEWRAALADAGQVLGGTR